MIPKPDNWNELTPEEKRTMRLDAWASGEGIQFDNPEAEAKYKKLVTLFRDAIELKKPPERVPVSAHGGGYALKRAGVLNKALMYDRWEDVAQALIDFTKDFDQCKLPSEIKKAVILYHGKITKDYRYIDNYL